jgi:hypothetical protein
MKEMNLWTVIKHESPKVKIHGPSQPRKIDYSHFSFITFQEMGSEWATFLSREFVQPLWDNTKTVFRRQFKVATRNTAFIFARLFQVRQTGRPQAGHLICCTWHQADDPKRLAARRTV